MTEKTIYVIHSRVAFVGEMEDGWYVRFEGSQERMKMGTEKPVLEQGDKVRITIEKV